MPQVFATLEDLNLRTAHGTVLPSLPKPLRTCPQQKFIKYGIFYRNNEALPGLDICSKCYNTHIYDTPPGSLPDINVLSGFSAGAATPSNPRNCDFNTPRILSLWSNSLRTNSLLALQEYWSDRKTLSPCAGKRGLKGHSASAKRWYKAAAIKDLLICSTCFEGHILATPFSNLFEPLKRRHIPEDEKWVCDLSLPYIVRALKRYSDNGDWQGFVEATRERLYLQPCAGINAVGPASRSWFTTHREIRGFCICEACYYDHFALTRHEREFSIHSRGNAMPGEAWSCDMAVPKLKIASNVLKEDVCPFDTWWQAAKTHVTAKPCPSDGVIKDSTWYVLATHEADFGVCPSCFYALVRPMGTALQAHFKAVEYPPGSISTCGLASGNPRFGLYVEKLEEAVNVGRPEVFTEFVVKWAGIPYCPRDVPVPNRRWWGNGEVTVCEECAEVLRIPTASFAKRLSLQRDRIAARASCDVYEPYLRKSCEQAVERGSFGEFCHIVRSWGS